MIVPLARKSVIAGILHKTAPLLPPRRTGAVFFCFGFFFVGSALPTSSALVFTSEPVATQAGESRPYEEETKRGATARVAIREGWSLPYGENGEMS